MAEFYASGRAIDLILALMVLETVVLLIYWRRTSRGVAPLALLLILASGGFLLLAVRAALTGVPWYWVGLCLVAAGTAHLADLWSRWSSPVHGPMTTPGLPDERARDDEHAPGSPGAA